MADGEEVDCSCFVVDQEKDAVIAKADAIAVVTVKLLDAVRARVVFQLKKFAGQALMNLFRQAAEVFSAERVRMTV
jgi:hypothetical protein